MDQLIQLEPEPTVLFARLSDTDIFYPVKQWTPEKTTRDVVMCDNSCLSNYYTNMRHPWIHSEECATDRWNILRGLKFKNYNYSK